MPPQTLEPSDLPRTPARPAAVTNSSTTPKPAPRTRHEASPKNQVPQGAMRVSPTISATSTRSGTTPAVAALPPPSPAEVTLATSAVASGLVVPRTASEVRYYGRDVAALLTRRGVTQVILAAELGTTQATISKAIAAPGRPLGPSLQAALASRY